MAQQLEVAFRFQTDRIRSPTRIYETSGDTDPRGRITADSSTQQWDIINLVKLYQGPTRNASTRVRESSHKRLHCRLDQSARHESFQGSRAVFRLAVATLK